MDPEAVEALLREEGVTMPLASVHGTALSRVVLRAAQALRRGQTLQAVEQQARARDMCLELGLAREGVLMELLLGAYVVHAGDVKLAAETYQSASARAEQSGLGDLGAQAQMALGALFLLRSQKDEAATAYTKSALFARDAQSALLAVEGFRLAGQMRMELGDEERAVDLWRRALDVAHAAPAVEAKASSASEAARALAALYRKRGLMEQALEVERQSRDFEPTG